jgi:alpha-1,2-mannosyltransferase
MLLALLWLLLIGFTAARFALVPIWKRDFFNYWLAPRALWSGVNPYDVVAYADFGLAHCAACLPQQFNFTYPPHSLFLFTPFAILPPYVSIAAWDVVSLAAFIYAARPLLPKGLPVLVAVLSPATLICLDYGQTGLLTSALFLIAARGSGLAAAVLTFKPHLGFLVAPALLLRSRRSFFLAIAGTVLLIAASAVVFGHWADFIAHAGTFQANQLFNEEEKNYYWILIGVTPAIGYGLAGALLFAIWAAIILSRNFNIFTAATATFLISPYGFHYDMSAACLGFVVLLYSYWREMRHWHKLVASLAFLTPVIVGFGTWWVPPILLLGLFVQAQWFPGVRVTVKSGCLAVVPVNGTEPLSNGAHLPSGK